MSRTLTASAYSEKNSSRYILLIFLFSSLALVSVWYWLEQSYFSFSRNTGYLADYELVTAPISLADYAQQSSGLAYNSDRDRLYVITNSPAQIHILTTQGKHIAKVDLVGFNDTEGITYLANDNFAVVSERTGAVSWFTLKPDYQTITFDPEKTTKIFSRPAGNKGLEGISYASDSSQLFLVKERSPKTIYALQWPVVNIEQPTYSIPWNAASEWLTRSFSGISYHQETKHLFILSRRSSSISEYTLSGEKIGSFALKSNFSRLQNEIGKAEGIVIASDGTLYICSETNQLYIFKKT
jgi:uncharacterized protein YjiK